MKTRTILRALALLASLAVPFSAWGQGCALSLSLADIDFGQFNRTTLQVSGGELPLPPRRLALNLVCETEQELTLTYHADAAAGQVFDGGVAGRYQLQISQARVDDQPVQWAAGGGSSPAQVGRLERQRGLQPMRAGTVVRGRRLSAQVEVEGTLDLAVLGATQAQQGQAQGSLQVAGQRRDLRLRVGFAPAAYRPTLSAGGQVDFGQIGAGELHRDKPTSFSRQTTLEVSCDAATRFALRAVDNRAGSASERLGVLPSTLFGIGRTSAGQPLGGFTAQLAPGTGRDGARASVLLGDAAAQVWRYAPEGWLHHDGQPTAFQHAHTGERTPGAWSGLSIPVTIDLHLAPARQLDLRQDTPIDGSATLEILYL